MLAPYPPRAGVLHCKFVSRLIVRFTRSIPKAIAVGDFDRNSSGGCRMETLLTGTTPNSERHYPCWEVE